MSVAGSESAAKRRRLSRTVEKETRAICAGIENMLEDEHSDELKYIIEQLHGPQERHVKKVATMLRKGILDKTATADDTDELNEKVTKYRNFRTDQLIELLVHMEPDLSSKVAKLRELGRSTLLKWVCFALHVKENTDLPSLYPTLRNWKVLKDFLKIVYHVLQDRLQALTTVDPEELKEDTISGHWSIDLDKNEIVAHTILQGEDGPIRFAYDFAGATDWIIDRVFSKDAKLISSELDSTISINGRCLKKTGRQLADEDGEWTNLPPLPAHIIGDGASSSPASASARAAAPVAPPAGSGRAIGGKGRGKARKAIIGKGNEK